MVWARTPGGTLDYQAALHYGQGRATAGLQTMDAVFKICGDWRESCGKPQVQPHAKRGKWGREGALAVLLICVHSSA